MGMEAKSEAEEPTLEELRTILTAIKNTDGIKKIQDAITAIISGTPDVNVTDRLARLLGGVNQLGTLTYSSDGVDITKTVENRDVDGYITSIEYYAGTTLKFTLTITRDANKRITSIERT